MIYYLKKFWKRNLTAIVIQLVTYTLISLQSLIQMQTFQSLIELDFRRMLIFTGISLTGWGVICLMQVFWGISVSKAIWAMNGQIRRDISATLLSKSRQDYHAQATGEYLSWLTSGVERIENSAWDSFFGLTAYICMALTAMVTLFSVHWSLLPISLVNALVLLLLPRLFTKKMQHLGDVCAREQAAATGKLKELLGGFDVLCFFGRRSLFLQGISHASDQIEKPRYEQSRGQAVIASGIIGYAKSLTGVGPTLLVAFLSIKGIILQAALAGTGNLFSSVSNGFEGIASLRLSIATSKAYFDRIQIHADGSGEHSGLSAVPPVQDAITLKDVSFRYETKPVLTNVSLRFENGKKYALTGPSGGGKSTLLKLLLGWLTDYDGTICFDGRNIKDFTPEQLQDQMSYIEQDVFLFNISIRDNITLGEKFSEAQMNKALRESALEGDLPSFENGLDTIVGENGSNLSGGQKQRVAIARALIHGRSILLVDEGTSALDQRNADIVEESLLANPELTLILVSHHLSEERKAKFDQVYDLDSKKIPA